MDSSLPDEVIFNILLQNLEIGDVLAVCQTSWRLHRLANDNNLWRVLCYRRFRNLERWIALDTNFKEIYHRKLKTLQNWRSGAPTKSLQLHARNAPQSYNIWRAYLDSSVNQVVQLSWHTEIGLVTFDADSGCTLQAVPFKEPMCAEKLPLESTLNSAPEEKRNVWIFGGNHEFVKCVDMASGNIIQQLTPPKSYVMRCVSLGDDLWATGGWANDVTLFDLSKSARDHSSQVVGCLKGHQSSVRVMAATNNKTIVTGGHDSVIRIWDCHTMRCLLTLEGHSGYVLNLEIRENKDPAQLFIETIVSAGTDGKVRIWKWVDDKLSLFKTCSSEETGQIYVMAFDKMRRRVIAAGFGGTVSIWNEDTGDRLASLVHGAVVGSLKYDESNQILVTGCNDFTVRVWDLRFVESGKVVLCCTLKSSNHIVYHVDFDEDMLVMTNANSSEPYTTLWDFRDPLVKNGSNKTVRNWLIPALSIAAVVVAIAVYQITKGL